MVEKHKNAKDAVICATGGAVGGASLSAMLGGMGLAVGGTAIGIGMAPVAAAGGIVGLAAYGIKKGLSKD